METLALDQRVRPWSCGRSAVLFRCQEVLSAVSSELGGFSVDLGSGERVSSESPLAPNENKDLAEEPRPAFAVFSRVYLTQSEMMNVRRQVNCTPATLHSPGCAGCWGIRDGQDKVLSPCRGWRWSKYWCFPSWIEPPALPEDNYNNNACLLSVY